MWERTDQAKACAGTRPDIRCFDKPELLTRDTISLPFPDPGLMIHHTNYFLPLAATGASRRSPAAISADERSVSQRPSGLAEGRIQAQRGGLSVRSNPSFVRVVARCDRTLGCIRSDTEEAQP